MKDDDEDKKGPAALIIGVGPPESEGEEDLALALKALGKAIRHEDWSRAAKAFKEAVHLCDYDEEEEGDKDEDEESEDDKDELVL